MTDWAVTHKLWEKWIVNNVGASGEPLKAALLINYDPAAPSRLVSFIAEQEGTNFKPADLRQFLNFIKRNNLQTEFFFLGSSQYLVTSIHEHWFCARCINTSRPAGEGVIIMQIAAYLLVAMYEGSIGSATQAMAAAEQFVWQLSRRIH
ncbi:uncharacterized protein LOC110026611 [Phalaenopsis equestris]|uniref:uncharacterized protein LOC110026611 n=1 Tax=Phalaenopsis equestris TaxID=78828 RepID=UPI0009E3ED8E|nr:uncharacterized protein LOC110026611 [Phalaenopsis equestris]